MTYKEAADALEIAKANVEWEYPLDYSIAFDMAIEALENMAKHLCFSCANNKAGICETQNLIACKNYKEKS